MADINEDDGISPAPIEANRSKFKIFHLTDAWTSFTIRGFFPCNFCRFAKTQKDHQQKTHGK